MSDSAIYFLFLTVTWAIIEFLRGRRLIYNVQTPKGSVINKALAVLLFITTAALALWDWKATLYVAAGVAFWKYCPGGHGRYFGASMGHWNPNEVEVRWIDWVIDRLMPWGGGGIIPASEHPQTEKWNRARGTLGMSLTGLQASPLIFMAGGFTAQAALFAMALGLFKGVAYGIQRYFPPIDDDIADAEPVWGGAVGAMLAVVSILNGAWG